MMKDMAAKFSIKLKTTAPYSAWQNGQNERVHSVVDSCLERVLADNPNTDPQFALKQAIFAKNNMPMYGGFSSFQLVFG